MSSTRSTPPGAARRATDETPRTRLIRADLTDAEWRALRLKALQRDQTVQSLVSELLRRAAAQWSA